MSTYYVHGVKHHLSGTTSTQDTDAGSIQSQECLFIINRWKDLQTLSSITMVKEGAAMKVTQIKTWENKTGYERLQNKLTLSYWGRLKQKTLS